MNQDQLSAQKIKEQGLLPLFYYDDAAVCIAITKALYEAGIYSIEFTNRGEMALENFKLILKERDRSMSGLLLGVGTIKTHREAVAFIESGADFLVSPVFDRNICDAAYTHKKFWVPGCTTPTEIHVAQQAGCNFIKLFPGNLLGPSYIEAIQPLFTGLDYVVTGGVDTTEENINAWFKSGVACIGMGSKLITKDLLQSKDYAGLTAKTKDVLAIIKRARK